MRSLTSALRASKALSKAIDRLLKPSAALILSLFACASDRSSSCVSFHQCETNMNEWVNKYELMHQKLHAIFV
jgi:CMP-N-acetylneuraminic acid synthetase